MIELYLSKVTENSETEQAGKLYARVSYKQAMTIQDMARHMAEHNTEATTAVTMVATQTLATSEDSPPTPEGGGLTQRWKK